eukprot:1386375-Rhodomonas_salina.1
MNERSVYLHVMGDALGSLAVVISASIIKTSESELRFLADPICSLVRRLLVRGFRVQGSGFRVPGSVPGCLKGQRGWLLTVMSHIPPAIALGRPNQGGWQGWSG